MAKIGKKPTDPGDRELVALALEGDQRAFAGLLSKYRNALLQHTLNYVNVIEDAEDICQRSFEKAFMNIDKYNSDYAFSTWLYSIAKNEAKDHLRKNKSSISAVSISNDNEAMNILSGLTPEEQVIVDQRISSLVRFINGLPELYRKPAELRFINDYAYEEIAKELNLPIGTVKTRLNRARKMLSKQFHDSKDGDNS